jgi:uncharacterized protein YeaO (DUF488 family)
MIHIKRIYEPPEKKDGYRILIDRLWPRGITKQEAAIDLWLKEIAPSTELRKGFAHKEENFEKFRIEYSSELQKNTEAVKKLKSIIKINETVTLIYAAKNPNLNHAIVLLAFIKP